MIISVFLYDDNTGPDAERNYQVEILKSLFPTKFTIYKKNRADFWEISSDSDRHPF